MKIGNNIYSLFVCIIWALKGMSTHEPFIALPFNEFDQTVGQGWRSFQIDDASPEKLKGLASIIQEYVEYHKATLPEDQLNILHFHAGQIYAFAHEQSLALEHFKKSYEYSLSLYEKQPIDSFKAWLIYVQATIAFLEKDITVLKVCARGLEDIHGDIVDNNRHVVAKLLEYHEKDYQEVYFSQA